MRTWVGNCAGGICTGNFENLSVSVKMCVLVLEPEMLGNNTGLRTDEWCSDTYGKELGCTRDPTAPGGPDACVLDEQGY